MARKSGKGDRPGNESRQVKKTFSFDEELARRVKCFAARYGLKESKVAAAALENHLSGFRAFGGPGGKPDTPEIRLVDRDVEPAREAI